MERTQITDIWAAVGDDGSGGGEGVLSILREIPAEVAVGKAAHLAGQAVYVNLIAYDPENARRVADAAYRTGKDFRMIRLSMAVDVTDQFPPPPVPAGMILVVGPEGVAAVSVPVRK